MATTQPFYHILLLLIQLCEIKAGFFEYKQTLISLAKMIIDYGKSALVSEYTLTATILQVKFYVKNRTRTKAIPTSRINAGFPAVHRPGKFSPLP